MSAFWQKRQRKLNKNKIEPEENPDDSQDGVNDPGAKGE